MAWITFEQLCWIVACVAAPLQRLLPARPAASAASATPAASADTEPQWHTRSQKQGKSIKQLLKEQKRAAGAANAHETLPDSELYLNTLKGHGDSITSVAISQDDGHVMTACNDQVKSQHNRPLPASHVAVASSARIHHLGSTVVFRSKCQKRCMPQVQRGLRQDTRVHSSMVCSRKLVKSCWHSHEGELIV